MRFIRFDGQAEQQGEVGQQGHTGQAGHHSHAGNGPYGDGLPLANLEAGLAGELYLRAVRPWRNMSIANALGLGRLMPLHGAMGVLRSGGIGLLLANGETETDIARAGMAWQRAWCALEHMGYAMQPLAALPLLHLRLAMGDPQTLDTAHQRLLEEAWTLLEQVLPHPKGRLPVMMFRAGVAAPIRHGTFRRPLSDFLLPAE